MSSNRVNKILSTKFLQHWFYDFIIINLVYDASGRYSSRENLANLTREYTRGSHSDLSRLGTNSYLGTSSSTTTSSGGRWAIYLWCPMTWRHNDVIFKLKWGVTHFKFRSYTSSVYMNISSTRPTSGSTSISSGYSSSRLSSTSSSLGSSSIGRSTGSSYRSTGSSSIGTGSSSFGSRSVKESIGSGYSNMYKSVSSIGSKIYQSFLGRAASRRYWRSSEVISGQNIYLKAKIWLFRLKLYQTV